MVETYRETPLEMGKVFDLFTKGIKEYTSKNKIGVVVLGLSGGIDSTVVAALCKASGVPIIGVSLPCSTNKDDEKSAAAIAGEEFCDKFTEINLQQPFEVMEKFCAEASGKEKTPISQGNIKARLRMITLYDIASKVGGIVMDTDNLTEHFLGFWTIHGDDADFNPIGGLWKHEVYALARYMKENVFKDSKALEASIALMPTDGNGVKEGGDLAQIAPGKTYDDVDEILHAWVGLDSRIKELVIKNYFDYGVFKKLCEKHGYETVEAVIMRSVRSEFKRKQRPFIIDVYRGLICEKDGKIME
jgi:nicotinamide-nucleotide amidase